LPRWKGCIPLLHKDKVPPYAAKGALYKEDFFMNTSNSRQKSRYLLKLLCALSIMTALSVVLDGYLSIPMGGIKFTFGFIPPAIIGMLYGPLPSAVVFGLADLLAVAFGLSFGRHKMCPSVSPKKSWEGFAGSVFGACLMTFLFTWLAGRENRGEACGFWRFVSWPVALAAGALIATFGTLGDLVESRFKRECGIKDSGGALPAGMGGFLDMFDSILFIPALAYPFMCYAHWLG
jgi:CDP-diglyceride synthetase